MSQKKWLSTSAFSSSAVTSLPAMLNRGLNLPGITFHLPNVTIPRATKLQPGLWVLHAVPLQESYNEETPAPETQQSRDPLVLLHPDENRAKRRGSPEPLQRLRTHTATAGTSTQTRFSSNL